MTINVFNYDFALQIKNVKTKPVNNRYYIQILNRTEFDGGYFHFDESYGFAGLLQTQLFTILISPLENHKTALFIQLINPLKLPSEILPASDPVSPIIDNNNNLIIESASTTNLTAEFVIIKILVLLSTNDLCSRSA